MGANPSDNGLLTGKRADPHDAAWDQILADPRLARTRSKLSIYELRLIIDACLGGPTRRDFAPDLRPSPECIAEIKRLEEAQAMGLHLAKGILVGAPTTEHGEG